MVQFDLSRAGLVPERLAALRGTAHKTERGGEPELGHVAGEVAAFDRKFGAAEQRAAEAPKGCQVERLLVGDFVGLGQRLPAKGGAEQSGGFGFAKKLQAEGGGAVEKVGDVEAMVGFAEFVVVGDAFVAVVQPLRFGIEDRGPDRVGGLAADRSEVLLRPGDGGAVCVAQNAAGGLAEVALRIGVVARVDDAVGRKMPLAQGEEGVEDEGRHPGAEAVGEDVVEGRGRGREVQNIGGVEFDIGEAEAGDGGLSDLDGAGGEIDAGEVAMG